ncbi:MAG: DUF815 domain-containing protein [Clostridia bacterium]|nr:DUF815 domain-containing protein [Clostridia bacterium]
MNNTEIVAKLKRLRFELNTLTVFSSLKNDSVLSALTEYISALCDENTDLIDKMSLYCNFADKLFKNHGDNLSKHIGSIVNDDENVYIRYICKKREISEVLKKSVDAELRILQKVADLKPEELVSPLEWDGYLPEFLTSEINIADTYYHRAENIGRFGYGIYSRYYMFNTDDDGKIIPVRNPDSQRLNELVDYKREQQIIIDNTKALLAGKPAANILLTGDAGTGKSSTIKAVVNEFKDEGLRILEVKKDQLRAIPAVLEELNENPLKFILFIDDLSFQYDDDNFAALKAILEGSVSAKSNNVVIYATSNRRHMVKETFSGREGDDIHRNDSMQETISLSERFGIHILFRKPDKFTYLNIVHHLAKEAGLDIPENELDLGAESFALRRANRSARAARQYVDSLISAK